MKFLNNLALKWKLILGFSSVLLLMVSVSVTVYVNLNKLIESSHWVEHTHKAIEMGNKIAASLVDMETGLRGYLVAGKDEFLEPFIQGKEDFGKLKISTSDLVHDNATQVGRLDEVAALQQLWIDEHVNIAIGYRQEVNAGANAASNFKEISARTIGKEKFDGFRSAISELNRQFDRSNDTIAQGVVQKILMDMINQETGQRGYLLTGLRGSLEPYQDGKKSFDKHVGTLRQLIDSAYDRDAVSENIQSLEHISAEWNENIAKVGILLKKQSVLESNSNHPVVEFVLKGSGKQLFDEFRTKTSALDSAFQQSKDVISLGLVTNLAKAMVNMETGYRGFLLTGKEPSLEPYEQGKTQFKATIEKLKNRIQSAYNITVVHEKLDLAISLAKQWNDLAAQPEINARETMNKVTRTAADISAFIEQGIGKKYMDKMRSVLNEFVAEEEALIAIRNTKQDSTANITSQLAAIGTIIALIIGGLLTVLLTRSIVGSIKQAVNVADKIAADDLSSEIKSDSKDELGQLLTSLSTMQANLKERIETERVISAENNRVKQALDNTSGNVMIADNKGNLIYLNHAATAFINGAENDFREEIPELNSTKLLGEQFDVLYKNPSNQGTQAAVLKETYIANVKVGSREIRIIANPILDPNGIYLGIVAEWIDRTKEVAVEREIQEIIDYSRAGDLSQRVSLDGKEDFFKTLSQGINDMVAISEQVINEIAKVMSAMAQGDLTNNINGDFQGAYDEIKNDINTTIAKFSEIVADINTNADEVLNGSNEITKGNSDLSVRTNEQAANLEETAASMEQMTATVRQNADSVKEADQLVGETRKFAENGTVVINRAVSAMNEISNSSAKISDIISVIDEIAFQTNLLALNASVEAARAGEQGRGFAVVASEVRNLAGRSAGAAKEIKDLIEDSVMKVDEGGKFVIESGETLEEIMNSVKKVSSVVSEIATASEEQSEGIGQVNQAVTAMDKMTQQNTSLVAEAAEASESMGKRAKYLNELVRFFEIQKDVGSRSRSDAAENKANSTENKVVTLNSSQKQENTPTLQATGTDDTAWEQF